MVRFIMAFSKPVERGKYMCIQLKEYVDAKMLTKHTIKKSDIQEWGLETSINYQLDPRGRINDSCSSYCRFHHRQVKFELFIGSNDNSDYANVRLCYIPASWYNWDVNTRYQDNTPYTHHNHNPGCESYIWALNTCFVKIIFHDVNNPAKIITRRFQIEPKSGCCGSTDHANTPPEEYTHYRNNEFIRKDELERQIGCKMECDGEFVPVTIEIKSCVNSVEVKHGSRITTYQEHRECQYDGNNSFKRAKIIIPEKNKPFTENFRSKKASTKFFKDPDIVFELEPNPSPVLLDAHSCILEGQSPVFSAMLLAEMAEKKSRVIKLKEGVDKEALQVFLKMIYEQSGWIYSDKSDKADTEEEEKLTIKLLLTVLKLAHMYQTVGIIDFCLDSLIARLDSELTFELALEMTRAGNLYNEIDLVQRSLQWFRGQLKTNRSTQFREQLRMFLKEDPSKANIEFVSQLLFTI